MGRPECTHDPEQLVDFLIPRLDLRDLSLQEALAQILDEYSRICVKTGETPGRFAYTLNAEPLGPINLHLRQISVLSALRLVAMQAGLDLSREGFALTFDAPARDPDAPLLTRAYPVTPDVVDLLHRLVDPEASPDVGDPFAAEPPPTAPELLTLLDTLGAVRAGGAAASFLSDSSTLVVKGDAVDAARLGDLVDHLASQQAHMVKTQVRFLDPPTSLEVPEHPLSGEDPEAFLVRAAGLAGTTLEPQPAVVSRFGQAATIEIGQEFIYPDPDQEGRFRTDWNGVRIDLQIDGFGFGLEGRGAVLAQTLSRDEAEPANVRLSRSEQEFLAFQQSGHTHVFETTTPEGAPRYVLVTHDLIDTTGTPAPDPAPRD